jgi:hypothetical protein
LEDPITFIGQYFCTIQSSLAKSDPTKDKFAITVFFANLGHSKHGNIPLIHTLLAFATDPALRNVRPLNYDHFDLLKGFEPNKAKL